jgi:3-hydroxybutyryl-CoA dehydrogenase
MPVVVGDKAASSPTRCCSATSTTPSRLYESRYATREDIDAAMRLGCGLPWGRCRCST